MKILKKLFKNIHYSDKDNFSKIVRDVISYKRIDIDEKMFFSSTTVYSIKDSYGSVSKETFPLKIFIPDFILENFSLHNKVQKKLILDFLKIFFNEIIYLAYNFEMNKKINIYTSSLNERQEEGDYFRNRRDVILFFGSFFKEKIYIRENIPKKVKNNNQFILGKNYLCSKVNSKNCLIGESFYSFLNRISVCVDVHYFEIENLREFFKTIGIKNASLIFSCINMRKVNTYKFIFVFEKNKCISAFSIPNYRKQILSLEFA